MRYLIYFISLVLVTACNYSGQFKEQSLTPIHFNKTSYIKDGKPFYLISGEFHYFRVPKSDWKKRMKLLKQAGGNCVATLVPWILHEPQEGAFNFDSDGIRDLEGFLKLAKEENLYVMVRPGPYQYSELAYDGLPEWLSKNYPELRAKTYQGADMRGSVASYQHPLFLKKVKTWFDKVCPLIAKYSVNKGGPVVMFQLDNELTGVQIWNGSIDYNHETMGFGKKDGKYPLFLKNKYDQITALNKNYGSKFSSFEEVFPIETQSYDKVEQIRQVKDYYDFYYDMAAQYLDTLADMAKSNGIDVPFVHNAANPEMIPYFKESVKKIKQPFLLGVDFYYNLDQNWGQNNPTPQYAARGFFGLEMLRLMGYPQTLFELPSGSASDWPSIAATDAKACYMLNLAIGMKGCNYYIFTGGPNPLGFGLTTDVYDYGAPIGANGEVRPIYYAQKEVADFISKENWLAEAGLRHDCRISLDFEYARAANYWKEKGDFSFSSPEAWTFTIKGLLTSSMCASISPEFCDISNTDFMKDTTPLIVVSSTAMSAEKQINIVTFLKQGGKVLLLPVVPEFDDNLNSCTILKDFIGKIEIAPIESTTVRASFGSIKNVKKNGVFAIEEMPENSEVLGIEEITGNPIACKIKTEGNGTLIFAGISWLASHNEQNKMLLYFLSKMDFKQIVNCDNPNIWHTVRSNGKDEMLFLMNLSSSVQTANIEFTDESEKLIEIGKLDIGAMSVKTIKP